MPVSEALLEAIAVAAELTGTQLTKPAARVMAEDLARYPEAQVLGALTRCRRELRGRLTPGEVIDRLQDGRPGPEEAWSAIPPDEAGSVVWSDEMAEAFAVARPLMDEGERIPARMAFLERYRALVRAARDSGKPVRWTPSLGHDVAGRERALIEAQRAGKLTREHVAGLLPRRTDATPEVLALLPDMSVEGKRRSLREALEEARAKKDIAA